MITSLSLSSPACVRECRRHVHAGLVSLCDSQGLGAMYVCFPQLHACLSQPEQKTFGAPHVFLITHSPTAWQEIVCVRVCAYGRGGGLQWREKGQLCFGCHVDGNKCQDHASVRWCQYTKLRVMDYSPDGNTCNADLVWVGRLFHLSLAGIKVT